MRLTQPFPYLILSEDVDENENDDEQHIWFDGIVQLDQMFEFRWNPRSFHWVNGNCFITDIRQAVCWTWLKNKRREYSQLNILLWVIDVSVNELVKKSGACYTLYFGKTAGMSV